MCVYLYNNVYLHTYPGAAWVRAHPPSISPAWRLAPSPCLCVTEKVFQALALALSLSLSGRVRAHVRRLECMRLYLNATHYTYYIYITSGA